MYELRANHIRRAFFRGCSTRGAHIRMPNYKRTCLPRGSRRLLDDWRLSFCAPSSRLSTFLAYSDFGYKVNFATMREKESRANNRGGSSARERKRSAKVHRLSNNKALHTLGALRCCFFLPRFAPIHRRLASARIYTGKLESEPNPSLSLSLSRARALFLSLSECIVAALVDISSRSRALLRFENFDSSRDKKYCNFNFRTVLGNIR